MVLTAAGLEPVKPQVLNPRLSLPSLIGCQTPLNSLIYGDNFGNYVRVTDSSVTDSSSVWPARKGGMGQSRASAMARSSSPSCTVT